MLVCGIDPHSYAGRPSPVYPARWRPRAGCRRTFDVLVDYTQPNVVDGQPPARRCQRGVDCVVGTTGLSNETLEGLRRARPRRGRCLFYAPNFTTGADAHDGVREGRRAAYFPGGRGHRVPPLQQEGRAVRLPPCAPPRSSQRRACPAREQQRRPRAATRRSAERRGRSRGSARRLRRARALPCAPWALRRPGQEVIFGSLGPDPRPSATTRGAHLHMPGVLLGIRSVGACSD
ncbi:MAG: 4-hydroxy-tetrahydrodipicolinate reductase [Adlercreutzia equolifaciens]